MLSEQFFQISTRAIRIPHMKLHHLPLIHHGPHSEHTIAAVHSHEMTNQEIPRTIRSTTFFHSQADHWQRTKQRLVIDVHLTKDPLQLGHCGLAIELDQQVFLAMCNHQWVTDWPATLGHHSGHLDVSIQGNTHRTTAGHLIVQHQDMIAWAITEGT